MVWLWPKGMKQTCKEKEGQAETRNGKAASTLCHLAVPAANTCPGHCYRLDQCIITQFLHQFLIPIQDEAS